VDTRTGFLISQIKSVSGRLFERILQDCGVEEFNGAQGRILYVLWQADRVPIVELSQKTGLAKNTLTSMLGRMEESGLILREQSEEDRRQTIISLTDKARELEEKYDEVSERANLLFFKGFTPAEIAELECLLSKVLVNLERSENDLKRGKDVTKWLK
jgi:DNA-binding MarR family transcriptional regulator